MFKPARMTRVLIGGHRNRLESVIDVLHDERLVHFEDFEDPTGTTTIGTPLEHGDEASALLLRVRGLLKGLNAEDSPARGFQGEAATAVDEAEDAIEGAIEAAAAARAKVASLDSDVSALAPLANLDVHYVPDLRSVKFHIGTVKNQPDFVGMEHEVWQAGDAIAVAVPNHHAETVEKALSAAGFAAVALPADGTPRDILSDLTVIHSEAVNEMQTAEAKVSGLAETWGPRLASIERHLSATVVKTQAPLKMAVTDTTFHIEGWIPVAKANRVQNAISAKLDESVYFESLGDAPKNAHHPTADDEAPVELVNKGPAKPYEFMLGLLGRPRYGEIDPTKLMFIFFPLFFGFMVGDVVVGLAIMAFGLYLKKNHIFGIGGPAVGRALFMGGVVAVVMGAVVFGEGLGIHFVVDDHALEEGELSWEAIIYGTHVVDNHTVLKGHFPEEGFIHRHVAGHGDHAATDGTHSIDAEHGDVQITPLAEDTEEHGTAISLAPHGTTHLSVNGWFNLGYYSKIHDIMPLLIWSVIIGVSHIVLGLLIGFRNIAKGHGVKLAVQEKASWLGVLVAVGMMATGQLGMGPSWFFAGGIGLMVTSVILLWMGLSATVGVGFIALFEVPGLFGNILSYTRLAAVGASKAGMAIAFSAIGAIVGGATLTPVWWVVYILGMIAITLLAILSGGLQALRLQFVEFFQKFYEGGGRPYKPFGRRQP